MKEKIVLEIVRDFFFGVWTVTLKTDPPKEFQSPILSVALSTATKAIEELVIADRDWLVRM